MKTSEQLFYGLALLLSTLIYSSCSVNEPAKSGKDQMTFFAEQSGCNMMLEKSSNSDSSFSYSFNNTLKIDFGIWGNCCPDSNRFVTDCNLKTDTIFVTVKDTAKDGCYCNCPYTIHLEITGLTKEQYLFYMTYPAQHNLGDSLKYREILKKKGF